MYIIIGMCPQVAAIVALKPGGCPWHGMTISISQDEQQETQKTVSVPEGVPAQQPTGKDPPNSPLGSSSTQMGVAEGDLREFCRSQGLAGYKLPRTVAAIVPPVAGSTASSLPVNASGKVQKTLLKELLVAAIQSQNEGMHQQRAIISKL